MTGDEFAAAVERAALFLLDMDASLDGQSRWKTVEDLTPEKQEEFFGLLYPVAFQMFANPMFLWTTDRTKTLELLRHLSPALEQYSGPRRHDRCLGDTLYDVIFRDIEDLWMERAASLIPFASPAPPMDPHGFLEHAVTAYLLGQDRAALALARGAAESILDELVSAQAPLRLLAASSPWLKERRPGDSPGSINRPFGQIEALHRQERLTDEEAAAFHEIREAGNDAVHGGDIDDDDVRAVLAHLRLILHRMGQ